MIGTLHLLLQQFDPLLFPLVALAMLNNAAMTAVVAIEERDDDNGDYDHQLLELEETLASEPTLVLWAWMLLVMVVVVLLLDQMLVMVVLSECLETSGDDSAAPGDLFLLRSGGMVLLPLLLMYELT